MANIIDISGKRFHRLQVTSIDTSIKSKKIKWKCICDCGNSVSVDGYHLRSGATKSCGCLSTEKLIARSLVHGKTDTAEYRIWCHIKGRCFNKSDAAYDSYGGRGIKICNSWASSFESFLEDLGERPSIHHSIDRINNDGNYEPGNCRWATRSQQANNRRIRRDSIYITYNNEKLTHQQWSSRLGGGRNLVRNRISAGWSESDAVTISPSNGGRSK